MFLGLRVSYFFVILFTLEKNVLPLLLESWNAHKFFFEFTLLFYFCFNDVLFPNPNDLFQFSLLCSFVYFFVIHDQWMLLSDTKSESKLWLHKNKISKKQIIFVIRWRNMNKYIILQNDIAIFRYTASILLKNWSNLETLANSELVPDSNKACP